MSNFLDILPFRQITFSPNAKCLTNNYFSNELFFKTFQSAVSASNYVYNWCNWCCKLQLVTHAVWQSILPSIFVITRNIYLCNIIPFSPFTAPLNYESYVNECLSPVEFLYVNPHPLCGSAEDDKLLCRYVHDVDVLEYIRVNWITISTPPISSYYVHTG